MSRGYYGVAIYHPKNSVNVGSLWRSAYVLDAKFIATIGRRYTRQASDTLKTERHLPLFNYANFEEFYSNLPANCRLIGVELAENAKPLKNFVHPQQACYLLGAEDYGLPSAVLNKCHDLLKLHGDISMNVSVAGSIVMHDRLDKRFNQPHRGVAL